MADRKLTPERRGYQVRGVLDILQALDEGKRPLYVLPTGAGKTVVAARVTQSLIQYGRRIHFWVHRTELVDQALETLQAALPWDAIGQIRAGTHTQPDALIQVAMVQTLIRRIKTQEIERPDVVFVDEAHHARASTWEALLEWCPDAKVVGLTATPSRLDGKGLHEHFDTMIEGAGDAALVEGGYLAPVKTLVPSHAQVIEWRRNRDTVTVAHAVKAYQDHASGKQAIYFGWTVADSREVADAFNAAGVSAAHVDGKTPIEQRRAVMERFRSGDLAVVCNFDIISEGFDAPACDAVILGAPTASVVRYLQRAGRARRPGKTAWILDLAGMSHYFGPSNQEREWTLADGAIKPKTGGLLPFDPEDVRRDRKPLERVDVELRELGEWGDDRDDVLTMPGVVERTGLTASSIRYRAMMGGTFPKPLWSRTGSATIWLASDIQNWIREEAEYLDKHEVSARLGVALSVFQGRRGHGHFPKPEKRGPNGLGLWHRQTVDRFAGQTTSIHEVADKTGYSLSGITLRVSRGTIPAPDSPWGGRPMAWRQETAVRIVHTLGTPELLTSAEVAKRLGISSSALYGRWRSGSFPPPCCPGVPHRWTPDVVEKAMRRRERWLNRRETMKLLGVGLIVLDGFIARGWIPPPIRKPGHRGLLFAPADVDALAIKIGTALSRYDIAAIVERTPQTFERRWSHFPDADFRIKVFLWHPATVRAWLTEHMPERLPALDKLLAERANRSPKEK